MLDFQTGKGKTVIIILEEEWETLLNFSPTSDTGFSCSIEQVT